MKKIFFTLCTVIGVFTLSGCSFSPSKEPKEEPFDESNQEIDFSQEEEKLINGG